MNTISANEQQELQDLDQEGEQQEEDRQHDQHNEHAHVVLLVCATGSLQRASGVLPRRRRVARALQPARTRPRLTTNSSTPAATPNACQTSWYPNQVGDSFGRFRKNRTAPPV